MRGAAARWIVAEVVSLASVFLSKVVVVPSKVTETVTGTDPPQEPPRIGVLASG